MGCDLLFISSITSLIHITIDTMSESASISASHEDFVLLFCLYDFHRIGPLPRVMYSPVCDFASACITSP